MLGPHCNLTFLAAVPGTTAISTPFGWYSHVVGTIGVGAWLGGPVAGLAHLIRPRTTRDVPPEACTVATITAETNEALGASQKGITANTAPFVMTFFESTHAQNTCAATLMSTCFASVHGISRGETTPAQLANGMNAAFIAAFGHWSGIRCHPHYRRHRGWRQHHHILLALTTFVQNPVIRNFSPLDHFLNGCTAQTVWTAHCR